MDVFAKCFEFTRDLEVQDDAAMLLAESAADLEQIDDARNALRLLLRKWPRSEFVPDARKKLGELNLRALRAKSSDTRPPVASAPAAPKPAPAKPASATPAPSTAAP